jgi:hypothetical integral membrane protein (TIGR02206 family)
VAARRRSGPWRLRVARIIGCALVADVVAYSVGLMVAGTWSASTDLPLALCDVAVLVAAVACWWQIPLLVELTYFWGLAGTLQGVLTPDLASGFPHVVFFEYVIGHLGIVTAAVFLVVGLRLQPRPGAVGRVFLVTAAYTAFVGAVDAVTGADYMFLRSPPSEWTMLQLLGPWPWYVLSAAGLALVLLMLLDLPFRVVRHAGGRPGPAARVRGGGGRPAATG